MNLLSEGIIKADGTPGANYSVAAQFQAQDTTAYELDPSGKSPICDAAGALGRGGYHQRSAAVRVGRGGKKIENGLASDTTNI